MKNPRELRAFAQSARARANEDPSPENIATVLRYDNELRKGPKKSREMGQSAVASALDATHVAFVDWTVVDEEGQGNVGGTIITKGLAAAVWDEHRANRDRADEGCVYKKWHQALGASHRWMAGTPEDRGVQHLEGVSPSEALLFPEVTHDMDGSPRVVSDDKTVRAAVSKMLREREN